MKKYKIAGNIFSIIVYLFLLLPLVVVIITSFGEGNRAVFPTHGFTLKWYQEALQLEDRCGEHGHIHCAGNNGKPVFLENKRENQRNI